MTDEAGELLSNDMGGRNMLESRGKAFWICCPICNEKTRFKIYQDTVLLNFPLYCRKCHREIIIDVAKMRIIVHPEPNA